MEELKVFDALKQLSKCKQREVVLPMMKKRAIVSQLLVNDDLTLKTSLVSPDLYEKEITKLVYKHIEFVDEKKPPFEDFVKHLTHIDRIVCIWGILNSSYSTIENQTIICPHCSNQFVEDIKYDDTLNEDTITLWQEELPYYEHTSLYKVDFNEENLDIESIEFIMKIPVIKRRIDLMNLIGIDAIKSNFQQLGSTFTQVEDVTLITNKIIFKLKDSEEKQELNSLQEIHAVFLNYIPHDIFKGILRNFEKTYGKYVPSFKKYYTCSKCEKDFEQEFNPELQLYQTFFL